MVFIKNSIFSTKMCELIYCFIYDLVGCSCIDLIKKTTDLKDVIHLGVSRAIVTHPQKILPQISTYFVAINSKIYFCLLLQINLTIYCGPRTYELRKYETIVGETLL